MPSPRIFLLVLLLAVGPLHAGRADPRTPITQLLPAPAVGHAFDAADHQQVPADLAALGYREDEYLFAGRAGVYAFKPGRPNADIQRLGETPYVDRMLIRRPLDAHRFSGTVVVEVINSALNFDALAAWPYMQRQIIRAGDIWVGVTATPAGIHSLQLANPARYGGLGFGTDPVGSCHSHSPQVGVIFDILTQIGQLLRQPEDPLNPLLGLHVQTLIATGYSQGALILSSYTNAIAPNLDQPVFDGYIAMAGIGGYALNNCESLTDLATRILAPVSNGRPLMQIQTTSETVLLPLGLPGESLHDRLIGAPYRYYDLAGSGHLDGLLIDQAPNDDDLQAAGGYDIHAAIQSCQLAYPPSHFPIDRVYAHLLAKMEAWIRWQQAPPPSRRFVLGGWVLPGHVLGGVRSPAADVPVADYFVGVGLPLLTHAGGFQPGIPCVFAAIEHDYSPARLRLMYGSHRRYVEQVKRSARQLQREGFLSAQDAAGIIRQADLAKIP